MASFESIMKKFLELYEQQAEEVLVKEFMTLKSQSQKYKEINRYPANAGQLQVNRRKNRFKDILPFEYTRVELHPVEGVEGSDYINANYVLGADGEINYIAAQGPLPNTVEDFWRMLWYHNIEVVVMACREVEMGKNKCERYWPQVRQSMDIGAITVTMVYEENVSNDFVIRDFTAQCQGEKQTIRQYHYNAWPDHGKPDSPDPIIRMIEMMNDYRKQPEVPIVVHCSAGCGRTGTLIGIDIAKIMLLSKNVDPDFSVFKIVEKMRQQRPAMVQAKEQYLFVYMAIAELAKRSLGMNPTLPPKPASKPAQAPTGKSYLNIDVNSPATVTSDAPTSSSSCNTSPPTPGSTGDQPFYENVNRQPPLPTRKRGSTPDVPEIDGLEEVLAKGPPVTKRPSKQRSVAGVNKTPQEDDKPTTSSSSQPMPKPRPRNRGNGSNKSENGSSTSPPQPPPKLTTPTPPPVAHRPTTPSGNGKPHLGTSSARMPPEVAARPKSPDMSRRPLPSTPDRSPPHSSGSSPMKSPQRRSFPDKPPELQSKPDGPDSMYSLVDPSLIVDTGPEIMVIDEGSNKSVPLRKLEEKRSGPGKKQIASPGSSKSSIMDTFRDILGDEVINSVDKKDKPDSDVTTRPLPSIPAYINEPPRKREDSLDGPPPEIPQRTDARLELVDSTSMSTSSVAAPTYDIPGEVTNSRPSSSPSPVPPAVIVSSEHMDYEEPTPPPVPLSNSPSGITKPPVPSSPVPHNKPVSATLPHTAPPPSSAPSSLAPFSTVNRGSGKVLGLFKKSRKDKKKPHITSEDSSTLPAMPEIIRTSSSKAVDDKYRFPGSLGYGVRLERPSGPRNEPSHWKTVALPNAIRVS